MIVGARVKGLALVAGKPASATSHCPADPAAVERLTSKIAAVSDEYAPYVTTPIDTQQSAYLAEFNARLDRIHDEAYLAYQCGHLEASHLEAFPSLTGP